MVKSEDWKDGFGLGTIVGGIIIVAFVFVAMIFNSCSGDRPTNNRTATEPVVDTVVAKSWVCDSVALIRNGNTWLPGWICDSANARIELLERLSAAKSRQLECYVNWFASEGLEPGEVLTNAHVLHPGDTMPFCVGGI